MNKYTIILLCLLIIFIPSLGCAGNKEDKVSLLIKELNGNNKRARQKAAIELGRINDKRAVPALLVVVEKNDDKILTALIIGILGDIGDRRAVQPLINILNNQKADDLQRQNSARALGKINDPKALPALYKNSNSNNPWLRKSVIRALGYFDSEESFQKIILGLKDKNILVRKEAVESLGRIKKQKCIPYLTTALNDQEDIVRATSAEQLGKLGFRKALVSLNKRLELENTDFVRQAINKAVKLINSKAK